jgi:hypothetical protein
MLEQMKLAAEDPPRRFLALAVDGLSIGHFSGYDIAMPYQHMPSPG